MLGIIRVARFLAAIERLAVIRRERKAALQAARQVRIGDEDAAEGDRIGMALRDRGFRGLAGEAAGGNSFGKFMPALNFL